MRESALERKPIFITQGGRAGHGAWLCLVLFALLSATTCSRGSWPPAPALMMIPRPGRRAGGMSLKAWGGRVVTGGRRKSANRGFEEIADLLPNSVPCSPSSRALSPGLPVAERQFHRLPPKRGLVGTDPAPAHPRYGDDTARAKTKALHNAAAEAIQTCTARAKLEVSSVCSEELSVVISLE